MNKPRSISTSRLVGLAALASTAAVLTGCGSGSSSSTSPAAPAASAATSTTSASTSAAPAHTAQVSISGYAFKPKTVTVAVGARITFTNLDQTAHTATSTRPGFDTGTLNAGKHATVVAKRPGTYTFYCQFHAFMRGIVIVK